MTYDLEVKIEHIKSGLVSAEQKLAEFEQMGQQAEGRLSDSFVAHLDDLRQQKNLLEKHLSTLENEKVQAWEQSNFGNDMVDVAQKMLASINKLLHKLSAHSD